MKIIIGVCLFIILQSIIVITLKFGVTAEQNVCYSNSISQLSKAINIELSRSQDSANVTKIRNLVNGIPLRGHETHCEEITDYIEGFIK